jgi:uncharacterized membrane-anchored protein YitT (DUF2179 family)
LLISLYAVLTALTYEIFVFPNQFAPAGLNGFATMVQYMVGLDIMGELSLLINLPMLAVAFFVLGRRYTQRTFTFTAVFSLALIVLGWVDLSPLIYRTNGDTGGAILAAIAGGLINGALYSLSVKAGGSTGGTDVIGAFVNHKYPEYNTVWIIFSINVAVAAMSFFVYDMNYQPVILCALYVFVGSKVSDSILKGARAAAKFEVVTTHPEELGRELMETLNHGCTVLPAKGMYTGMDKFVLVCVVNPRQVVDFERIIQKYDNTFAYISTVNGTVGEFHRIK